MSTTPEENKRLVRRIREEVEDQGDLDAIDEIFAENVVTHTPMGELHGPEAIRELYESESKGFANSTETIHSVIAEGDTVAMRLTESGVHDSEFMGIEPTGRQFEVQTMAFFRIADGKIAEWWMQPDTFGFMQQLGVTAADLEAAVPANDD
ncbi:ester cyclase [Salinirubrum litoreum]|uniref:Ester cyclase n=1 Tax=Salinirubrum litoreum TaxID=1126234 RepID=A0ABD5RB16_9EURY|nr:ester cyclase [Salinirubrum litoreum]